LARPSLDGVIRCGERLRAWAFDARCGTFDARCGTFVRTRLSHMEETRETAGSSVTLAGTHQLSGWEPLSAKGARRYVVEICGGAVISCSPYAHGQMKQTEALIARTTGAGM